MMYCGTEAELDGCVLTLEYVKLFAFALLLVVASWIAIGYMVVIREVGFSRLVHRQRSPIDFVSLGGFPSLAALCHTSKHKRSVAAHL